MNFIMLEDHNLVREGVSNIIESKTSFKCLGTFPAPEDAKKFIEDFFSDKDEDLICITDINLGSKDGLEFIRDVKKTFPRLYCLVYSMFTGAGIVEQAVRAGACGFVSKNADSKVLIEAMGEYKNRKFFMETELSSDYVIYTSLFQSLTKREKELLDLFFLEKTNEDIAEKMGISTRSIENYFSRIFSKMGVSGRKEMIELYGRKN